MKTIGIVVCGSAGRMGSAILRLASENPAFRIEGAVEQKGHPAVGTVIAGATVTDSLESVSSKTAVIMDFTIPVATLVHIETAQKNGNPIVIGTTGFTPGETDRLKKISAKIPVLLAPNMSFGVNALFDIIANAARLLRGYEIEITETHHHNKKDAPSGTALKLANVICETLGKDPEKTLVYGRKGITGARNPGEIGVHALRMGDVVGEHSVYFGAHNEVIEISHRCGNRDALAAGALEAAAFLNGQKPGWYSMKDVLLK